MRTDFKQLLLLAGDTLGLYLALFLSLAIRFQRDPRPELWNNHWPTFTLVFFLWLAVFYVSGLYDLRKAKNNLWFLGTFVSSLFVNLLLTVGFFYILNIQQLSPKTILLIFTGLYLLIFALWRLTAHFLLSTTAFRNRLIFLGTSEEANELINTFHNSPQLGYETVAILNTNSETKAAFSEIIILNDTTNLLQFIKDKKIDTLILVSNDLKEKIGNLLYEAILSRLNIFSLDTFYENITHRVPLSALSQGWFLENLKDPEKNAYETIKRWVDIALAILMLIPFGLCFIPVALFIKFTDKGLIFYKQTRVGRDGQNFFIYKFRSMIEDAEKNGPQFTTTNDVRITKVGKILRILRLDETPQAINILKNEMSFIGPRPERPEFVAELQKRMPFYNARHLVKPGITGWAQANYKYTDSLEGNLIKLQYDLFYIKNRSLLLDALTILKTFNAIVRRKKK
ncbi:MAG: sugar transferase [Candidatus Magasanikbacteria bacterium]|nr:sugar transferase [Candidatus Magasanikbacteria bacterium]